MPPKSNFNLETLAESLPAIFDQAQFSTASHKKNCVTLYKLQTSSSAVVESLRKGINNVGIKLIGEKAFGDLFLNMVNRILVVKKGSPAADRIVRFIGSYIKFMCGKVEASQENAEDDDTPASRFVSRLLKHLVKGLEAKNKVVRYRCISIIAEMMAYLGEVDEELYISLRESLLDRLQDKEPLVRSYAVIALAKLAGVEDSTDLANGEQPVMMFLLDRLSYDESVEVRRAALLHIPVLANTLPALLTRTRDVDALTRKLVYSAVLPKLDHPKRMSILQREQVIRQGLGDREDSVRVAAARLLTSWLALFEGNLVEFLGLFDVMIGDVAEEAVKSLFTIDSKILDNCKFEEATWKTATPESALLARVFVEHCIQIKDQERLESSIPVITAFAFHIQTQYNHFLELLSQLDDVHTPSHRGIGGRMGRGEDEEALEEELTDVTFVLSDMIKLAVLLDYSDEIGRRKMFAIIREMLVHDSLPDKLIGPCLNALNILSSDERDLIRLLVEIVSELRNPPEVEGMEALTLESPNPDDQMINLTLRNKPHQPIDAIEKAKLDAIDVRCLDICIGVLEQIKGSFEDNSVLGGVLADLIIPSIKRKELILREKGLISLGQCCLIARTMALSSFQLFLNELQTSPESLKLQILRIIFDIIMQYEKDFLVEGSPNMIKMITFLMQSFEAEESDQVQALICIGLSKLMLLGLVTDERVLASLVLAYVSPATAGNQQLRQCLAYFLPVYCYSSSQNQRRMQSIFISTYDLVVRAYDSCDEDQDMITPQMFAQLFADWTNPQKVAPIFGHDPVTQQVQVDLATELLRNLYESDRSNADKELFCQLLMKLYFPSNISATAFNTLYILTLHLQEQCPFDEPAADKLFTKFQNALVKQYAKDVEAFDEEACFADEAYKGLFEFIGLSTVSSKKSNKPARSGRKPKTEKDDDSLMRQQLQAAKSPSPSVPSKANSSRSDSSSSASEEEASSSDGRPATPTPAPAKSRSNGKQTNGKTVRSTKVSHKTVIQEQEFVEENNIPEHEESGSTGSGSATPPSKDRGSKRLRSPTKVSSMASPEHKRRSVRSRGTKK